MMLAVANKVHKMMRAPGFLEAMVRGFQRLGHSSFAARASNEGEGENTFFYLNAGELQGGVRERREESEKKQFINGQL